MGKAMTHYLLCLLLFTNLKKTFLLDFASVEGKPSSDQHEF